MVPHILRHNESQR